MDNEDHEAFVEAMHWFPTLDVLEDIAKAFDKVYTEKDVEDWTDEDFEEI